MVRLGRSKKLTIVLFNDLFLVVLLVRIQIMLNLLDLQ
jgi:hypothetical protein